MPDICLVQCFIYYRYTVNTSEDLILLTEKYATNYPNLCKIMIAVWVLSDSIPQAFFGKGMVNVPKYNSSGGILSNL